MPTNKLVVSEFNAETGQLTERDLTADELAQREIDAMNENLYLQHKNAKDAERVLLLQKIGITAEEAGLLLG